MLSNACSPASLAWAPARITGVLLIGLALLMASGSALAHRLQVFASADGDSIQGKVYFVGGHPARGVEVQLLDAEGGQVAELSTDDQGRFRFRVSAASDYRVVAQSGDGHRAEWPIAASELLGAFEGALPAAASANSARSNPVDEVAPPSDFARPGSSGDAERSGAGVEPADTGALPLGAGADLELALRALIQREIEQGTEQGIERAIEPGVFREIDSLVEQAVARQILPLREALAEAQAQASFRDVLGGLGYIAGLAGLGLWWTRRRQRQQSDPDKVDG